MPSEVEMSVCLSLDNFSVGRRMEISAGPTAPTAKIELERSVLARLGGVALTGRSCSLVGR